MKKGTPVVIPSLEEIKTEQERIQYTKRYRSALRSTISVLVVVAAFSVLLSMLWLPFIRIYGVSMSPTLTDGDIGVCVRTSHFQRGDVVVFYYNNKILVKRVIAMPGEWVDIDEQGTVYINDEAIDEPYLEEKDIGTGNIQYPYQVPESTIFVLGDHRSTSVDSRHSTVGCVAQEQIVGKMIIRVWPFTRLTLLN